MQVNLFTMKNLHLIFLAFLLGVVGQRTLGQESLRSYSIVPPSPEVSALLEYSLPEVDHCTGEPNINLPVYTIREGNLELPISVAYQSGGVRVSQKPSTAGLGWRLNCAAAIGRTVMGKPDDMNRANMRGLMFLTDNSKKFRNNLLAIEAEHNPFDINYLQGEYEATSILGTEYYEGKADLANDIFQIGGCGLNATVIYDYSSGNPKPTVSSPQGLIVEGTPVSRSFKVVNAQGKTFIFGEREYARFTGNYGSPQLTQQLDSARYVSAWHLSCIAGQNGDSIKFKYTERPGRYHDGGYQYHNYLSDNRVGVAPGFQTGCHSAVYYPKVLSEIESRSTIVKLHYSSQTSVDLLTSIEIYAKEGSPTLLRTIRFNYGRPDFHSQDTSSRSGQMLLSISDNGDKIYEFDYYDTPYSYNTVEYNAQDFGGFYNGQDDNDWLVGEVNRSGASNRDVAPMYAPYLSLKSIKFPTGGLTEFVWESHDVGYINSGAVKNGEGTGAYTSYETFTLCALTNPNLRNLRIDNFAVGKGTRVKLDLTKYFCMAEINYLTSEYEEEHFFDLHSRYPKVVFYKDGKTDKFHTFYIDRKTIEAHGSAPFELSLAEGIYTVALENPTDVARAEDNLIREFNFSGSPAGRVHIYVEKSTQAQTAETNKKIWSGLRIKRMVSYSLSDTLYHDFLYPELDGSQSSGVAKSQPYFTNTWYYGTSNPDVPGELWAEIETTGTVAFANTPVAEPDVQYRKTATALGRREWFNAGSSYLASSRKGFEFTTAADAGCQDFNYTPYLGCQPVGARMNTSMAFRRGLPKRSYLPLAEGYSETEWYYNIFIDDEPPTFTTEPFVISDYSTAPYDRSGSCKFYGIGQYTMFPYNITVKEENIVSDRGAVFRKKYGYFFDSFTTRPDFGNRRYERVLLADGDSVTTYFTYRPLSGNFYSSDVESAVCVKDNKIISAIRTQYKAGTSLPEATFTLSNNQADAAEYISGSQATTQKLKNLISRPLYTYQYDSGGRLIQINLQGRVLASYLWGYRGAYPVIEAVGVSYESLKASAGSVLVQSLTEGSTGFTASALTELRDRLQNAFPSNPIFGFTYHWLFGMLSKTDARAHTRTFEYDHRGRLSSISDINNFIIHQYVYSTNWQEGN